MAASFQRAALDAGIAKGTADARRGKGERSRTEDAAQQRRGIALAAPRQLASETAALSAF